MAGRFDGACGTRCVCGVHKRTEMGEEKKEANRRGRLILEVAS